MKPILSDQDLDTIFRSARSYNCWSDTAVSDVTIQAIYDLLRWGPTSANCSPARFFFVKSQAAKERLKPALMSGNVEKVMTAPVTAIIAYDTTFYDRIPELFPHAPEAREWFAGDPALAEETAFRNSTLQGAYLIIAARALGLDCGPMSGFDKAKVDATFFAGTPLKSNFLCAIGEGTTQRLFPRHPRLAFDDACKIL
ncbi:MAG: malonic semialdehyde reductase [Alphaproteobacteria bacterium]|nr:MAG: malonic semialdehyde reductase [Alphaproteobacteria bacterium]